jgi:hypothetical protein
MSTTEMKNTINHLNIAYSEYSVKAKEYLEKLKVFIEENGFECTKESKESIKLNIWGINVIVKTEISFKDKINTFQKGELNAYIFVEENEQLIFYFNFDKIGNIGDINNSFTIETFAIYFLNNLIENLIIISRQLDLKFSLY